MTLLISPINHSLQATVRVPGSKSLTNRVLLIAALARGATRLTNALFSDDPNFFTAALLVLGFDVQLDPARSEMTVTGLGGAIPAKQASLFIGNAGTAARFLSALLTLGHGEYLLDGDERMRQRPIGDLVSALNGLGARLEAVDDCPPVKIVASGLPGGRTSVAGDVSSQFLSALLMVAPYAKAPIEIEVTTELNSKPYVDMTLAVMQDFGVQVRRAGYRNFSIPLSTYQLPISNLQSQTSNRKSPIPNPQSPIVNRPSPIPYPQSPAPSPLASYTIESDASAASYFFAAPAILGGSVRVENISRRSKQGDMAFLDVLRKMGCAISEGQDSIEVSAGPPLSGVDVDMSDIPDTAQTLAAIAPFAASPTRIRGIASARVKETDRVAGACAELRRLGVDVEEHDDGMSIYPCEEFKPASIRTYNDHRMAMAFSLVGLRVPGVTIENPACVTKTFPDFFATLESLR
jgi:3-phosphoshikimate 1-carboxyvinyltransferase